MRFKPTSYLNPYFGHGRSLPRRPYDICESPIAQRKRVVRPKEELQIGNSDELSNLPESETRDQKISEATASTPPPLSRSSVHDQSIRMADLALEKKNHINTKKTPTLKAFESKSIT
ncbi:unnamed protein product [Brassica oleracea var. botrytis]|uniref:BnaC01g15450D protein n=2 Tax=Brassica napus TaxID=3708 RepID=A0A078IZH2_BRANA|nr:uncharacterized protein LOC111201912 [Brassica napus]KAH0902080.1 hypothetical protein HID58_041583 [Brassica napus]CAF2071156.1 unnamed protein product [Brassica napus]CDY54851.1 BnaC01g15450D [Brassica napus]